jgi:precorrin-2 dehydrogenase/sirohydrochlorin ferrochelatase/precorrin-6A/cobalt-precorrin-6A reductase
MQGPFSHEMNVATIKTRNISALVTKESGAAGGFPEKLSAAKACGAKLIVIRRPEEKSEGVSVEAAMELLIKTLKPSPSKQTTVEPQAETCTHFPLFIPLRSKAVLVVGGGKVAARRARVLIGFGASITVISPEICAEMQEIIGSITWKQQHFDSIDQKYSLVLAATDDRETNKSIGESAKAMDIPVSVADRKEESTFWFPAIAKGDGIVAGFISEYGNHDAVKEAAEKVREVLCSE